MNMISANEARARSDAAPDPIENVMTIDEAMTRIFDKIRSVSTFEKRYCMTIIIPKIFNRDATLTLKQLGYKVNGRRQFLNISWEHRG